MKRRMLAVYSMAVLATGCSTTPVSEPQPTIPAEILAEDTCQQYVKFEPPLTIEEFPEGAFAGKGIKATVIVSFGLDGSGKAIKPEVVYSWPRKLFDETSLSRLSRMQFAAGVTKDSCAYVRTYTTRSAGTLKIPVDSGVKPTGRELND